MLFLGSDRTSFTIATLGVGSAVAAAACCHVILLLGKRGRCATGSSRGLKLSLLLGSYAPGGAVLRGVRVPVCMCPADLRESQDDEGLVAIDVKVKSGKIVDVRAPSGPDLRPQSEQGSWFTFPPLSIVAGGAILMSLFGDAHTHLIKTHTVPRIRNPTGATNDALRCQMDDTGRWSGTPGDVQQRVDFALRTAWHHGCAAIRTHLDGATPEDPKLQTLVYDVLDQARKVWTPRGLVIQGVANLYLPLYLNSDFADRHVKEASMHEGVVLGAYCGLHHVNDCDNTTIASAFETLFQYALDYDMDVDLHIDETNDSECCALLPMCASLRRFRQKGYTGRVVLGHVCSLALVDQSLVESAINSLRELSPITVICNPYANLTLMDRRGSGPPVGLEIPRDVPRTPRWRGITLLQELRAAGVAVAAASDNVRDSWHTYGDYDCLGVLTLAVGLGHLDTAPNFGSWSDIVTSRPMAAMGLPSTIIAPGVPADFILFPSARRASELLSRPQQDRVVVRKGKVQYSSLPHYAELDDLVAEPTKRVHASSNITRGASNSALNQEN